MFLANILDWLNDDNPTAHRVLSVVGPPGVGKSYLLHRVHELLQQSGWLIFWINLSRDVNIRGTCPDVTAGDGLRAWLVDAIERYVSDATVSGSTMILCRPKP